MIRLYQGIDSFPAMPEFISQVGTDRNIGGITVTVRNHLVFFQRRSN
jgi:hypothetical protein